LHNIAYANIRKRLEIVQSLRRPNGIVLEFPENAGQKPGGGAEALTPQEPDSKVERLILSKTLAGTGWEIRPAVDLSPHYADGDKPEFVAGLVLQAIEEGQAQYLANDRLRKMAGVA
jgi:hypothetical protein